MRLRPATEQGWIERRIVFRPKTRFFTVLSILWLLVSPSAASALIHHQIFSLSSLGIFFWILVSLHPLFFLLALYFRLTEPKQVVKQRFLDPNYDFWREN